MTRCALVGCDEIAFVDEPVIVTPSQMPHEYRRSIEIQGVSIKTPTSVFFYICYENNQICPKISVNAAE